MVGVESEEWISNYLYQDGLHPNHAGHTLICDALKKVIVL
jgi:lysophospholipase L1-like esterase